MVNGHESDTVDSAHGSDTVANTCVVGFFHILNNPAVHAKLLHDLKAVWPDANTRLGWTELEKIPYLVRLPPLPVSCQVHRIFLLMVAFRVLLSKSPSE